jgi:hypothetical protein
MERFELPPTIKELISARNKLKQHYEKILTENGGEALSFTLDGNLVGDLGEAIAVELFGIRLVNKRSTTGIDGYTRDGKNTVQVKATGTARGPAFRLTETKADYLLFFDLDFTSAMGTIVFNGPEHYATSMLPEKFSGQRMLTRTQIRQADTMVKDHERLPRLDRRSPQQFSPLASATFP